MHIYLNSFIIINYKMIQLSDIDFSKSTELCEIMTRFGSDKGCNAHHNYSMVYTKLFETMRNEQLNIFELGLGTNYTDVPSSMGQNGKPGASLYGWKEYFQNAQVFGADVDKRILFDCDRIKTYYADQLKSDTIIDMWNNINEEMDIIIEDGLHTYDANINFLINSFHKVKKGGMYIIEDVQQYEISHFNDTLISLKSKLNYSDFIILDIPYSKRGTDNVMIVIYN